MLRLRGEAVREVCWGEDGWSRWRKRGRAKEEVADGLEALRLKEMLVRR
jgi:hypothetical protein